MIKLVCLVTLAVVASTPAALAQTVVAKGGETVSTGGEARQILLKDKSSITAGANSTVKIGRYESARQGGAKSTVVEVTKGAFRFVSGTAKPESYKIETPLASLGVRGTVIEGVIESGAEMFLLVEGAFEICTSRECKTVATPGQYTLVLADGRIETPVSCDAQILEINAANDLVQSCLYQHIHRGGNQGTRTCIAQARPTPVARCTLPECVPFLYIQPPTPAPICN